MADLKTTSSDIESIISGAPIEIDLAYPLTDREEGFRWFMRQPTDWLYDMANAVREAAEAEVLAQPEIIAVKSLPPTDDWVENQVDEKKRTEERIAELQTREEFLTPEEALELENLRDYVGRIIDPLKYSRAHQIASRASNRAFENWLMPRLIVDAQGKVLWDVGTEEGKHAWIALGRNIKSELKTSFYKVIFLVSIAKNSNAGQKSA
jgi:hypothetical protein